MTHLLMHWVTMSFGERLIALRKARHFTQQALADATGIHISQIKRYEGRSVQPSVDALKKLALALSVSTDTLLFEADERGPGDDLKLQFEAVARMPAEERRIVKALLEGMIIKYEAGRWNAASDQEGDSGTAKAG